LVKYEDSGIGDGIEPAWNSSIITDSWSITGFRNWIWNGTGLEFLNSYGFHHKIPETELELKRLGIYYLFNLEGL